MADVSRYVILPQVHTTTTGNLAHLATTTTTTTTTHLPPPPHTTDTRDDTRSATRTLGNTSFGGTDAGGVIPQEAVVTSLPTRSIMTELPPEKGNTQPAHQGMVDDDCPCANVFTILNIWDQCWTEIEAVEACKWLRAAGFPQYAQMYEDQQFPIDISSVEKDHDFLDKDSIQSLFRRLNTLNKCANMKIEAPPRKSGDESDEEEQCALSDKWRFQRSSRRWSRRDLDDVLINANDKNADDSIDKSGLRSCSSHDSVLTDNEQSLSQLEDSPLLHPRSTHRHGSVPDSPFYDHPYPANLSVPSSGEKSERRSLSPISPRLRRAASERFKGAKIFLKRIESFKTKKNKTKKAIPPGGKVEISGPVVMDSGSFQERIDRLGCVDLSPTSEKSPLLETVTLRQRSSDSSHSMSPVLKEPVVSGPHSPTSKRNGCVFLDSSSSIPSGSSTLSEGQSHSEDPLYNLEHLTPPPPTVYPGGHRRNHSSSDIMDMYSAASSEAKQGSYPMLTSNGYIETTNGNQINYRTGSFNLGSDSGEYREGLSKRNASKRNAEPPKEVKKEEVKTRESKPSESNGENRLSVYDNVPVSDSTDAQRELDMILHDLFQNIDGLSKSLALSVYDEPVIDNAEISDITVESTECSDVADSAMPPLITTTATSPTSQTSGFSLTTKESLTTSSSGQAMEEADQASASSSNHELSDGDTPGSREEDGSDLPESRERRDSGVGSSLTRAPSDKRRHRIRWHSFVKSHRPSFNSRSLQISNMSAGQLMVLRKLSLLKVTSLMEKYSPSNRSGWNWIMPKFIKRFKTPDYKDKQVFGVPLLVVLQRTGQPLPQCILYAMRSLRRTARDAVGIFRKSGVRSRIQKLHSQIEINPDVDFNALQAYDVADLLKQYFRELPECLLTNKLSETFITTFTHVPPEARLEALQAAVMLLPDENREVLQSLLLFLSDMAEHASENQMTASNLAVCFAPSLFHMCGPRNNPSASPKRNRKNMGIPDQKDLMEQKAAHECLTAMITDCKRMFTVPEDMLSKCRFSYIEQGDPVSIEDLVRRRGDSESASDHTAYIESCIQGLLRESHNKFKGWISSSTSNSTDVAYKKVGDGHPLRLWKCSVDVEAPPTEVLDRILHERHIWDEDLLKWRVVETLDKETDVFQYVTNNMAPHPTRDFTELRSWRTNLPKGACVLVSTSVDHPDAGLIGVVRGVTLASRYLIEPCGSGKSRLTHMCRIDLRGHTPEWYNKVYGHLCANYCVRIRDSFRQDMENTAGPETKV